MRDYFKPLRRKLGVVTLIIACVFLTGWVRSQSSYDELKFVDRFPTPERIELHFAISCDSVFGIIISSFKSQITAATSKSNLFDYRNEPGTKSVDNRFGQMGVEWMNQSFGFRFGEADVGGNETLGIQPIGEIKIWLIPYLSIVIPLTLLSAYLLLSKPRSKSTSPEIDRV